METPIETVNVMVETPRGVLVLLQGYAFMYCTPTALLAEWALRLRAALDQEEQSGHRFLFVDKTQQTVGALPDHRSRADPPPQSEPLEFPLTREASRLLDEIAARQGRSSGAILRESVLLLRDLLQAAVCGWSVQILDKEGHVDGFLGNVVGRRTTLH